MITYLAVDTVVVMLSSFVQLKSMFICIVFGISSLEFILNLTLFDVRGVWLVIGLATALGSKSIPVEASVMNSYPGCR